MHTKPSPLILMLVVVTFLAASILPEAGVSAQGEAGGANVPIPLQPLNTIESKTPTYAWTRVVGATNYQYQVYQDTTRLLDGRISASTCGKSACSIKPAFPLTFETYKWRVRARLSGSWMPWSEYAVFFVSAPSFHSSFNGSMAGWKSRSAAKWMLQPAKVIAHGELMKWSSLYRSSGLFKDFRYTAWVNRYHPNGNSCLAFRMGSLTGSEYDDWYPGYLFCLGEDWQFIILRYDAPESYTTLHDYTPSSSIILDAWNELEVVAQGDRFDFYINCDHVATVIDDTYDRGYVGITMFKNSGSFTTLMVDWAKLSVLGKLRDYRNEAAGR